MKPNSNIDVVVSIIESLDSYLMTQEFDILFTMGSKLSFMAYTLEASEDDSLAIIIPSLITFTELIHRISQSQTLINRFRVLIEAFLHDLKSWLNHYFIEKNFELIASNELESLRANVQSIQVLLDEKDELSDLDDIFF